MIRSKIKNKMGKVGGNVKKVAKRLHADEAGSLKLPGGPRVKFTKKMLSRSRVIARGSQIDEVKGLVKKYGGKAKKWAKKKGTDHLGREVHWYEHPGIGRVKIKVK